MSLENDIATVIVSQGILKQSGIAQYLNVPNDSTFQLAIDGLLKKMAIKYAPGSMPGDIDPTFEHVFVVVHINLS
jgi:hypothetical protein